MACICSMCISPALFLALCGCCLLSLSSPFSSALPSKCFFCCIRALESCSPLSQVCVCVYVCLYSVSPMPLVLKSSNQWWSFFFFANLINTESFLFLTEHWTENAKKNKMLKNAMTTCTRESKQSKGSEKSRVSGGSYVERGRGGEEARRR